MLKRAKPDFDCEWFSAISAIPTEQAIVDLFLPRGIYPNVKPLFNARLHRSIAVIPPRRDRRPLPGELKLPEVAGQSSDRLDLDKLEGPARYCDAQARLFRREEPQPDRTRAGDMPDAFLRESRGRVPVVILNGFLGSGKTTLLKNLLAQARRREMKIGVVVNDMSELDVDGQLVAESDLLEHEGRHFRTIHDCVLSSHKGIGRLREAVDSLLADGPLDLILVETSGSCHPMPLVEFFLGRSDVRLTGVLVLVDAAMIDGDYGGGRRIVPTMQRNLQAGRRDTTNLLVEQVMFCSHLILTKIDRIDDAKIRPIAEALHDLNPFVSVGSAPFGNLPLDDILAMQDYHVGRVAKLFEELRPAIEIEQQNDRPYGLATRVLHDDRPFHPQRLFDTCQHHLGQHIYRSKGFFYLPSRDDVSLLWNQAAGGVDLELVGHWRAGILEDEGVNLDAQEREALRAQLAKHPGRFGDRRCHLTVIGDASHIDRFTDALRACFLTEAEIDAWQSGRPFPD
ncbi:MAG: GTP-binding protein, partial [Planctomycetota bacterium]